MALSRLSVNPSGVLQRNGAPFRTGGVNIFQIVHNDYPSSRLMSHSEIDSLFSKASSIGAGVARAHTLGVNIGSSSNHLVTGVTGTGSTPTITYNTAVWEVMDYAVQAAGLAGVYLMVPLTDELGYYHGGKRQWVNYRRPGTCSTDGNVKAANSSTERAAENYFYSDTQIQADYKQYISDWLNHVNQYTGIAYKNDPTIAFVETGNELWTADDYRTWSPGIAAYIKGIAPNVIVMDGMAADGSSYWDSNGGDSLEHIMTTEALASSSFGGHGIHPYSYFTSADITRGARRAAGYGKMFVPGEYAWSKSTADAIRAAAEAEPNVPFTAFWSLQNDADLHNSGAAYGGDDVALYYPGKDSTQTAAVAAVQSHATRMAAAVASTGSSGGSAFADTFTGTNGAAVDSTKWTLTSSSTGSTATIQNNQAKLTTSAVGGYSGRVVMPSKAPVSVDQRVTFDASPVDSLEGYLQIILRTASTGSDMGDVGCYRLEINNQYGSAEIAQRGTTPVSLGTGTIPGWAIGAVTHFDYSVIGSRIRLWAWTTGSQPTTPLIDVTNAVVTAAGSQGLIYNGGNAAVATSMLVDNWSPSSSFAASYTGDASLSSASGLTASATTTSTASSSASLSSASGLTVSATVTFQGAASLSSASGLTAAATTATAGVVPIANFTEDFTTFSGTKWTRPDTTSIQFVGGRGRLYSYASYVTLGSVEKDFSLTGSQIVFQMPTRTTAADGGVFGMELLSATYGGAQIYAGVYANSTGSWAELLGASTQYPAPFVAAPWFRIRDSGSGLLSFEQSPDGLTWTAFTTFQWTGALPADTQVTFFAGGGATNTTSTSYTEIDNINITPVPATISGDSSLSSASGLTASATTSTPGATVSGDASLSSASGLVSDGTVTTTPVAATITGAASFSSASGLTASATTASVFGTTTPPSANLNGWKFFGSEDFTVPATMGSDFTNKYPTWTGYTGHDTSGNGTYDSTKVLSVHDGMLDFYVHTENGVHYVASPNPQLNGEWARLYGRFAVRFKSDPVPGYKVAWLHWPADPNGWTQGEVDFPESDLDGTIGGFVHQVDGDPSVNQYYFDTGVPMAGGWHTAVVEWTPGKLRFLLDDVQVGLTTDTKAVPKVPMFWALQTETQLGGGPPPNSSAGHVYVDWVAEWAYDTTATAPAVNIITGSGSLASASDFSVSAVVTKNGFVSLSSGSGLSVDATVTSPSGGAADLSASSSLSVDPGPSEVFGILPVLGASSALYALVGGQLVLADPIALSASSGLYAGVLTEVTGSVDLSSTSYLSALTYIAPVVYGQVDGSPTVSTLTATAKVYGSIYRFITPSRRVRRGKGFRDRSGLNVQGISVLRKDGFFTQHEGDVDFALDDFDAVYLGGRVYYITSDEYDELERAGYGEYLSIILPALPADPVESGFGSGPYGAGAFTSTLQETP